MDLLNTKNFAILEISLISDVYLVGVMYINVCFAFTDYNLHLTVIVFSISKEFLFLKEKSAYLDFYELRKL